MKAVPIDTSEVIKTLQENLGALRSVNYQQLSKAEKDEMRKELLEVRELALSIKKRMEERGAAASLPADRHGGRNLGPSTSRVCYERAGGCNSKIS